MGISVKDCLDCLHVRTQPTVGSTIPYSGWLLNHEMVEKSSWEQASMPMCTHASLLLCSRPWIPVINCLKRLPWRHYHDELLPGTVSRNKLLSLLICFLSGYFIKATEFQLEREGRKKRVMKGGWTWTEYLIHTNENVIRKSIIFFNNECMFIKKTI